MSFNFFYLFRCISLYQPVIHGPFEANISFLSRSILDHFKTFLFHQCLAGFVIVSWSLFVQSAFFSSSFIFTVYLIRLHTLHLFVYSTLDKHTHTNTLTSSKPSWNKNERKKGEEWGGGKKKNKNEFVRWTIEQ